MKKRISLYNMKKAGEHVTSLFEKSNMTYEELYTSRHKIEEAAFNFIEENKMESGDNLILLINETELYFVAGIVRACFAKNICLTVVSFEDFVDNNKGIWSIENYFVSEQQKEENIDGCEEYPIYSEDESNMTYPCLIELKNGSNGIFDQTFSTESGNEENCHATGYELRNSDDCSDWWLEFEDSHGKLHYGR